MEDETVAHIFPSKEDQGQVVEVEEVNDSSEQAPIRLCEAKASLEVLDLFILQQAGDQSEYLAMVRKLRNTVAKLGIKN
uniref:Uncharacterized protein n=1 Tax=Hyaloperonospora arabidopsidis (strain Emoy2) TaxID=559515 RepID=M4BG56_HYAAE